MTNKERAIDFVSRWLRDSSGFHVGLSDGNTEPDYNDLVDRVAALLDARPPQTYLEASESQCEECRKWLVWADNLTGNKHYLASKMRSEIQTRLDARPQDGEPTVEEVLTQVKLLFPDRAVIVRNGGSWPIRSESPVEVEAEISIYGLPVFRAATLSEAMDKVRAWHKEQKQ